MKRIFRITLFHSLLAISLFSFLACADDDPSPTCKFKDQNVQGEINGETFVLEKGFANIYNDELSIQLYTIGEIAGNEVCYSIFFGTKVNASFRVPNKVGLYEISPDNQPVRFYDPAESLNIKATQGFVEILTITSTQVTGKIVAGTGKNSCINGNFSITFCE